MKNLIVGAIVIGLVKLYGGHYHQKSEVFNPYNQRVCEMPDSLGDERKWWDGIGTICGDLLCDRRKCARWVGGSFVKDAVTLVEDRQYHLCWARHNGVRLLGGTYSPKGRFEISSK